MLDDISATRKAPRAAKSSATDCRANHSTPWMVSFGQVQKLTYWSGQLPACPLGEVEELTAAAVEVGNNVACAATGARNGRLLLGFERPCAGNHAVDGLVCALRCVAKQVQRDDGVFRQSFLVEQNLVVVEGC